jgi:Na+-driven multidrug efflux pump
MAIGARDVARARQVAWTAGAVSAASVGAIGLIVAGMPQVWSGLFTGDAGVLAAADLYLVWAGPWFAFLGLGLALYFASQGSGRMLPPVAAGFVRLLVIAGGGWWLTTAGAPMWALFALVGGSMVAFGLSVAAAVYLTPWGRRGA